MLTVVCSGKAAPGASTAVWALALAWPRQALVVDCDVDGGDLAAGFLAGRMPTDRGLLSWAADARGEVPAIRAASMLAEHSTVVPERDGVWLLPGVADATAGRAMTAPVWGALALALERARQVLDRDVIVDAGRLLADRGMGVLLHAADRVLVAVRPQVRSIHACGQAISVLRSVLGDVDRVSLLVTGPGPYSDAEMAKATGLPVAGRLADDARGAGLVSDGPAVSWARLARCALLRSATTIAGRIAEPAGVKGEEAWA